MEIKVLSLEERQELIGKANLPITISTEHSLALKSNLGISWNQMREVTRYNKYRFKMLFFLIDRWFKALGVSIASERQQRKLAKDLLPVDNLVAEKGAFIVTVDKKTEIHAVMSQI